MSNANDQEPDSIGGGTYNPPEQIASLSDRRLAVFRAEMLARIDRRLDLLVEAMSGPPASAESQQQATQADETADAGQTPDRPNDPAQTLADAFHEAGLEADVRANDGKLWFDLGYLETETFETYVKEPEMVQFDPDGNMSMNNYVEEADLDRYLREVVLS